MELSEKEIEVFNKCNPNELDILISTFYPYAFQMLGGGKSIIYKKGYEEDGEKIVISYSKKDKIKHVNYSNKLDIIEILCKIEEDSFKEIPKFSHGVIYTSVHFKNEYFRYDDKVLIRPIGQPFSDFVYNKYPAILEYSYNGSVNPRIDLARRMQRYDEIVWLLSLLFKFIVEDNKEDYKNYYGYELQKNEEILIEVNDSLAIHINEFDLERKKNLRFKRGFIIEEFQPILNKQKFNDGDIVDKFGILPIGIEDDAHYWSDINYEDKGIYASHYIYAVLNKFFNQDLKTIMLLKASFWFSNASKNKNTADRIIALTTVLECLIDKSSEKCTCGEQKKYNIKQKVKTLVSEYCKGLEEKDKELIRTISYFYDVRSSIVHGNELPLFEISNSRSFDPIINKTKKYINYYLFVVRLVVLNWYLDKDLDDEIRYMKRIEWVSNDFKFTF